MFLFITDNVASDIVTLPAEESKHCVRVLRMRRGDSLLVTDGCGTVAEAQVLEPDAAGCVVELKKRNFVAPHWGLHIAVAPTKNIDRFEWFVEKAVEVGVSEITPIVCEHSERRQLNGDRLQRIVVAAVKQSLKAHIPILNPSMTLCDFLSLPLPEQRFVCHCDGTRASLPALYQRGMPAVVLVGPEGDFSPAEIAAAHDAGFRSTILGEARLRTETAALYATVALNMMNCEL